MSQARKAIEVMKKTGKLTEAVSVALGKSRAYDLKEEMGASQQSQVWFAPNQDALNQLVMRIEDKLPDCTYTIADHTNGAQSGFAVTVSGQMADNDVASLAAVKGCVRLDGPSQEL